MSSIEMQWPEPQLLEVVIDARPEDHEVAGMLETIDRALGGDEPIVVMMRVESDHTLSLPRRRDLAAWLQQHRHRLERSCVAAAFVLPHPVTRLGLAGILAMTVMPVPYFVTGDRDEAARWLRSRLAGRVLRAAAGS